MGQTLLNIDKIDTEQLLVPIVGTAPLIIHRFSEKAKRQMLEAQQGVKKPKQVRDPQAEYEASFYHTKGGGYGFPVVGFKAATVGAARFYGKDVKMTELRQFLFFKGQFASTDASALVEIHGEPRMREDVCRIGMGSADLRYRPEFPEWTAELHIEYVKNALTQNSVLSLIDAGGLGVGVGEWRPERKGDFGTYRIDPSREIGVLRGGASR